MSIREEKLSTWGKINLFAEEETKLLHRKIFFRQIDNYDELITNLSDIIDGIKKLNGNKNDRP